MSRGRAVEARPFFFRANRHEPEPDMQVAVAIFEIHIPYAHSLKEKRMVVKSLRDRIRNRFEISVAEVALQDVHQRARLGISFVVSDGANADGMFEKISAFVETNAEATLAGWTSELLDFDDSVSLGIPNMNWKDDETFS